MLKKKLIFLGDIKSSIEDVMQEATEFVGLCYGATGKDLTSKRFNSWVKKSQGKLSSPPKLCTIPPTTESFRQNILRAHFQCIIWNACLEADPPGIDPTKYGWERDETNEILLPVMVPKGVEAIPKDILKIFACSCSTYEPCSQGNCSCRKNQLSCTINCKCYQTHCFSEFSVKEDENAEEQTEKCDTDDEDILER